MCHKDALDILSNSLNLENKLDTWLEYWLKCLNNSRNTPKYV